MIVRPSSYGTSPQPDNIWQLIAGFLMLGVGGASVFALIFAARITFAGLEFFFSAQPPGLATVALHNVIASALSGAFAGIAIAIVRRARVKVPHAAHALVSASFLDGGFGSIALEGIVGLLVGAVNGTSGIVSFAQLLFGSQHVSLRGDFYPITHFVLFGGAGGGGFGGDAFFAMLWFMLVVIMAAILAAVIMGPLVSVLLSGLSGALRGGVESAVARSSPFKVGIARGLQIGIIVGIIEALCSAWAYWHYHHVPTDTSTGPALRGAVFFTGE